MLIDPSMHEPVEGTPWSEAAARAAIQEIVDQALVARLPGGGWPWHPLDGEAASPPESSLYMGSAGNLLALAHLERAGAAKVDLDLPSAIARAEEAYEAAPDPPSPEPVPSLLCGRSGILLARHVIASSSDVLDRLHATLVGNRRNPVWELLWGTPGTMLAALHAWRSTGEERFRDVYLRDVDDLMEASQLVDPPGCHLWTQDLYGRARRFAGAGHGQAGNLLGPLLGQELLAPSRRDELVERAEAIVARTSVEEEGQRNWPALVGDTSCDRTQWCHGAPGIVTSLASFPRGHARMEEILRDAGELVWRAGPLTKGPGLCHGTAGNGYAFLVLHRRTGEPLWLDRARAFAMHAIAQQRRMREAHGTGRYSLWTGDPGVAVYLWHCIAGDGGLLGLDLL